MKNILITIIIILVAFTFISCKGTDTNSSTKAERSAYEKISPEKAKEMMEAGDVTIVDVRRPDEYNSGHVPGAILVPNESIGRTEPAELPDKDATLLIYCRSGRRSKEAAMKLVDMGYRHVYDFGGIIDWPYEIEKK